MSARVSSVRGFTLIELMVTLTVIMILLLVAVPSFYSYRQRAAERAVSEQVQGLWQQARLESAKRNTWVRFGVAGGGTCIGVATQGLIASAAPTTGTASACDCTGADATNLCDIATFPALPGDTGEWRGVTISGTPTLGGNTGLAILEPKNAMLTGSGDAGAISFASPTGPKNYKVNLRIDAMGRGNLCLSTSSDDMSDYANRVCSP